MSELEPRDARTRADLARVDAYFSVDVDVSAAEFDWVHQHGLALLHVEVGRLREVAARLEAGRGELAAAATEALEALHEAGDMDSHDALERAVQRWARAR